METQFKIGDAVFQKNGTPMVVESIQQIQCVWIDSNGIPHRDIFPPNELLIEFELSERAEPSGRVLVS